MEAIPTAPSVNEDPSHSPSSPDSAGLVDWITLILLIAAAFALRMFRLNTKPYWFDECFSVEVARLNWTNFRHLLWWREANMSLYYVLLRFWLHLGQSETFIRGLSVVFSVASLPALYWLAKWLFNRRIALIATAFLAANAYHLRYAQEARSYALFGLLTTMSSGYFVAFLRTSERKYRVGYILASILSVYAHFYALLLLAAQWFVVSRANLPQETIDPHKIKSELRRAWTIIAIAIAPLIIFVAKTGAGPIKWIPRPGFRELAQLWEHLSGAVSWPIALIAAIACLAALIPFGKHLAAKNQSWPTWRCQFLIIWLLFPPIFTFLLSFARPVFLERYLIFCIPPLLILAAAGFARLRPAWRLALALLGFFYFTPQALLFVYGHDFDTERDASGVATNFILDHAQPDDAIIFHIAETRIPYEFFHSVRAGVNTASLQFNSRPDNSQQGPEILSPHHSAGLDYHDFTGKPAPDLLATQAADHPRIWLMLMNNGPPGKPDPTTVMLTQLLPASFPHVQVWQFSRVEVRLYSKQ